MKLRTAIFGGTAVIILIMILQVDCVNPSTAREIIRQKLCICPCGNPKGGKLYTVPNVHLNWFEAVAHCSSIGMSIATIKDANDRRLLQLYLEQNRPKLRSQSINHTPFWIGANNLATGSGLRWGLSNQEVKTSEWNQVSKSSSEPYCVYILGDSMKWVQAPCGYEQRQFICEY